MKTLQTLCVVFLLTAGICWAGEPVGTVTDNGDYKSVVLPVVHDTTMRHVEDLSSAELAFIASVPCGGGLRDAVREMILARVVHLPVSGKYQFGDAVHYWSIYQAWTGPAKVTVPLIPGPKGDKGVAGRDGKDGRDGCDGKNGRDGIDGKDGCDGIDGKDGRDGKDGAPGPRGPKGDKGDTVFVDRNPINITNISFNTAPLASYAMMGQYGPVMSSVGLMGVSWAPSSNTTVNVSTAVSTAVANNNVIAIDGTAKGNAEANSDGTSVIK
jgi:hypothetical protein